MQQDRIILFHKHPSSARLRFLRFSYYSVCGFEPLPRLAMLMDDEDKPVVAVHPATMLREVQQRLGLESAELQVEGEYQARVDVAGGPVNVMLMGFTSIDPPFELAQRLDAQFIELTEARDLTDVELLLLRRAYEVVIGG